MIPNRKIITWSTRSAHKILFRLAKHLFFSLHIRFTSVFFPRCILITVRAKWWGVDLYVETTLRQAMFLNERFYTRWTNLKCRFARIIVYGNVARAREPDDTHNGAIELYSRALLAGLVGARRKAIASMQQLLTSNSNIISTKMIVYSEKKL